MGERPCKIGRDARRQECGEVEGHTALSVLIPTTLQAQANKALRSQSERTISRRLVYNQELRMVGSPQKNTQGNLIYATVTERRYNDEKHRFYSLTEIGTISAL